MSTSAINHNTLDDEDNEPEPLEGTDAVGEWLGVTASTVSSYLYRSKQGFYKERFPTASGRITTAIPGVYVLGWHASRKQEILDWKKRNLPGRGTGGGRPKIPRHK